MVWTGRISEIPGNGPVGESGVLGLAARRSKANKEARVVERKVCFVLDAGNWRGEGWGRGTLVPKADFPPPPIGGQELV